MTEYTRFVVDVFGIRNAELIARIGPINTDRFRQACVGMMGALEAHAARERDSALLIWVSAYACGCIANVACGRHRWLEVIGALAILAQGGHSMADVSDVLEQASEVL